MILRRLTSYLLLTTAGLYAQAPIEPKALHEDFLVLRKTLESAHSGLYRYVPKSAMDAKFEAAYRKLEKPMASVDFRLVLAEVLADIRCGHTQLRDDAALKELLASRALFPFRTVFERDRLYVVENLTTDPGIRPGTEILSINGRKIKAIEQALLPLLPRDGSIETGKRRRLAQVLPVYYNLKLDPSSEFEMQIRDAPSASPHTVKVAGVKLADGQKNAGANPANTVVRANIAKLMNWSNENVALRFLGSGRTEVAHLRIRGFGGKDFTELLAKHFTTMREKEVGTLVLDLRGNGGGVDNYGALLVSYMGSTPFRYFERIEMRTFDPPRENNDFTDKEREQMKGGTIPNPKGAGFLVLPTVHTGLNEQQPPKVPFTGKVFILIDGGCFSTCADVAAVAHHLKRATFIGEETGGGYYGNNSGAGLTLTLPNSKIPVSVPMWEYWNAVPGYKHKDRGTIPEHAVPAHIADILAGKDMVLEKAIALAK